MPKNTINAVNYPTVTAALKRAEEQKYNYEKNLLNKRFIYVFIGDNNKINFKEVVFKKSSYLHLTGLDYKGNQSKKRQGLVINGTDALDFYKRLGTDETLINDVSFTQGNTQEETLRYFGYTQHKLDNLSQLTQLSHKAEFIGKYIGDRDFDVIVNRNMSSLAFLQKRNIYLPASLLFGKPQKVATNIKPILAIFSREKQLYQLEYLNSKVNIGKRVFSPELLSKIQIASFDNPEVKFKASSLEDLKQSFTVSVKRNFVEKVNNLSDKRKNAFENDTSLAEYEKERKIFITGIRDNFEAKIAIDVLSKQNEEIPNELVNEEISEIRNKFQLNASTISTPNVNKPMQMSITEDKPMQIDFSMQGGAAAMTLNPQMPNNEFFTQIANVIAKGVDSLLHKKSDTKHTQVEISDRQQPTPQQSENKTITPTKAPAPQPVPQKQSLKAMMSKAAQQKKDMAAATKSMEKWADDVQDIQQSRKNNIHR